LQFQIERLSGGGALLEIALPRLEAIDLRFDGETAAL